jgi:metal-responsive CopG/Arc/MetJ family transcriptional regulator
MSAIISFSSDSDFSNSLEDLMEKSGYKNRSRFMRDAALYFSEYKQRGELSQMADDEVLEGHLVIYYQHGIEKKLLDIRHSNELEISSYNHSCLKHSHTCVDLMQAIGTAANFRKVMAQLNDTASVDKVTFISAPMRDDGCC